MYYRKISILLSLIILLLSVSACSFNQPQVSTPVAPGATFPPRDPISVELSVSKLPKLNEPVTVTVTVTAIEGDFPDAEAWIEFTGVYIGGDLTWNGDLVKDVPIQFSATVAFVTEGNRGITAYASNYSPEEQTPHWASYGILSFYIGKDESTFGGVIEDKPPWGWYPGEPKHVGHGIIHLDSSMLLNKQPVPVFKVMQSLKDVRQLQEEGLLPEELSHGWWRLEEIDFDQFFVIGFWDAARPTSGYYADIPYNAPNDVSWDKGTITVNARLVPPASKDLIRSRPTSSVVLTKVSRAPIPESGDEALQLVLGGMTEFVFIINGTEVERQTHDIVPKAGETPRG